MNAAPIPRIVLGAWRCKDDLFRRSAGAPDGVFVDLNSRIVAHRGALVWPPPLELKVFILIAMARPGFRLKRADLIEALYGDDPEGGPNDPWGVIGVTVARIRKWSSRFGVIITSGWGAGYSISGAPEILAAAE